MEGIIIIRQENDVCEARENKVRGQKKMHLDHGACSDRTEIEKRREEQQGRGQAVRTI